MELYDRYKKGFEKVVKMDQEHEAEIKPDSETKNEIGTVRVELKERE